MDGLERHAQAGSENHSVTPSEPIREGSDSHSITAFADLRLQDSHQSLGGTEGTTDGRNRGTDQSEGVG